MLMGIVKKNGIMIVGLRPPARRAGRVGRARHHDASLDASGDL